MIDKKIFSHLKAIGDIKTVISGAENLETAIRECVHIILTAIGILLGIGIGIGISIWMLNVLQGESDNFLTEPNLIACLSGAGLSIVFAIITNIIALRKVDKFKVYDLDRQ